MPKFWTKNALFGYFQANVFFEVTTLKFVELQNFSKKERNPELRDRKWVIWIFLGYNFKKRLSYLHQHRQNFAEKQNCLNFRPKMPSRLILSQHPQIGQIAKFFTIKKVTKFVTQNTLFGYFYARFLKSYCHI